MPGAWEDNPDTPDPSNMVINWVAFVMVEEHPTSFSPFSSMDCMLLSHFSFNDFVVIAVTVEEPPIPFSPFSSADCTMLNHFSFNDFIAIAFPDIAGDLDVQI